MKLTLESLQLLLNDLSSIIQIFFFILGISLIIIPLLFSLTFYHDNVIISSSTTITKITIFRLYQLSKRITHYIHICLLMAFEEVGVFPLLERITSWIPTLSSTTVAFLFDSNNKSSTTLPCDTIDYKTANICIQSSYNDNDNDNNNNNVLIVPGLVNTGNTCYLNSVLQALSSLPRLQLYLDQMNQQYSQHHLPVTRSLLKTVRLLSKPVDEQQRNHILSFRPIEIVSAINTNHEVINREQQDAHELFQLLSGALDTEETTAIVKNNSGHGLKDILNWPHVTSSSSSLLSPPSFEYNEFSKKSNFHHQHYLGNEDRHHPSLSQLQARQHNNPFVGLLANRLSCTRCGYTEAIRHSSFNNIQLNLPLTSTTTLDECLDQVTTMEYLDDASCRKCSIVDLVERLRNELEHLKQKAKQCENTKSKKDLLTKMVQVEMQHRQFNERLIAETIEDDLPSKDQLHVPYRSIYGKSTKQAMFAKPPKVLCLHISRSAFHPSGVIYKNKCHLQFPEYLDLQQYCTNGTLHTESNIPISKNHHHHSMEEKQQEQQQKQIFYNNNNNNKSKYKLMSVIVHYGSHNYGHFIAYKRRLISDGCSCYQCKTNPKECIWEGKDTWYRISDENVDICTIDEVLSANPYMLLYESMEPMTTTKNEPFMALSSLLSTSIATIHSIKRKPILLSTTTTTTTTPSISSAFSSIPSSLSSSPSSTHFNENIELLNTLDHYHQHHHEYNNNNNTITNTNINTNTNTNTNTTDKLQADTSVYNSQIYHYQQQQQNESLLVHRNQQRRKMSWEASYTVIPTSCN